jgi:hypothetical protein
LERSSFFNSVNGDRRYKAEDWAAYFSSFIGNGFFPVPSSGLQVTAGGGMSITLRAGRAWINGYFYTNDVDATFPLETADGVLRRIDRVVIRWDLTARNITANIKRSQPSSNPTPPPLQRDADVWEICLADVMIRNGATAISQTDITDQRLNPALCGVVAAVVNQIDTTAFNAQLQAWFEEYRGLSKTEYAALAEYVSEAIRLHDDWFVNFKRDNKQGFDDWFDKLRKDGAQDYEEWFAAFKQDTAIDYEEWFAALQAVLDTANAIASESGIMDTVTTLLDRFIVSPVRPFNQREGGLWFDTSSGITDIEDGDGEGLTAPPGVVISSDDPGDTATLWLRI